MKITKFLICCLEVLLIVVLLVLGYKQFRSFGKKESFIKEEKKESELSLVMVGDALIHGSLYRDAQIGDDDYNFSYLFEYITPLIKQHDLAFYNQETIIGGSELGYSSYPRFNTPHQFGDAMVNLGFNLIALANNHSLDKGEKGIENSIKYWQQHDVLIAGTYLSLEERNMQPIKIKNNISYTLLAYTTYTNGLKAPKGKEYLVNVFNYDLVKKDIMRVRDQVDLLIVSMHWGNEYVNVPNKEQKEIAKFLAELGVDIVIGHHPHVIQPIEYIDGTLILYSLGNFVSAQKGVDRLIGMICSLIITKKHENNHITINFSDLTVKFIYTYYQNFKNFKIIPYHMVTPKILTNFEQIFEKYSKIVTSLEESVVIIK
ncbi:MAG: CapA family protein [Bacilli bacterium]|jgi:poly-gamma-glutamate synthesis protein (capsule biosynthesis protein)|nr:CapA family protein [Bacilli bacterium]